MESIKHFFEKVLNFLSYPIFSQGSSEFSVGRIIYLLVGIWIVLLLSKFIRRFIVDKLVAKYATDKGVSLAFGTIFRYFFVFIGFVIVIQSTGVDMSALTILAGALGVGIGFGLQNVTNNFISGIIILFERPIKVGDRVELPELDHLAGDVVNISARSTTIITNDNIAIIVPNSKFVSDSVINWSYNDTSVRFAIPVGVSYKEDPEEIRKILIDIALAHQGILKEPAPEVIFDEYGENSINFVLRVFTSKYSRTPLILKSELYYEIFKKFKETGVEIPFPQRDVYIKELKGKE